MLEKKFIPLLFLLLSLMAIRAFGIELGDTRAQVEALHDSAPVGDRPKGIAIYRWDLWKLEIHYDNDVIWSLIYTKIDPMTQDDIHSILDQNGGFDHWRASNVVRSRTLGWTRSDGATAAFTDDNHNRTLTLEGGRMPYTGTETTGTAATGTATAGSATAPAPAGAMVSVPLKPGAVLPAAQQQPAPAPSPGATNAATSRKPAAIPVIVLQAPPKNETALSKTIDWVAAQIPRTFEFNGRTIMMLFATFGVVMIVLGLFLRSRAQ